MIMGTETLAVAYGLCTAVSWGAADFSGGVASRRSNILSVLIGGQIMGAMLLFCLALVFSEKWPAWDQVVMGVAAGTSGSYGIVKLYKGLVNGRMGMVAPLCALATAGTAVSFGVFIHGLPSGVQMAGMGLALAAVWVLTAKAGESATREEIANALPAGVGIGLVLILIDQMDSQAFFFPLFLARLTSIVIFFLVGTARGGLTLPARSLWPFVALSGLLDAGGNAFFALSTNLGRLDITAVLASLYPAATIILAYGLLGERFRKRQWLGLAAALGALVLISV